MATMMFNGQPAELVGQPLMTTATVGPVTNQVCNFSVTEDASAIFSVNAAGKFEFDGRSFDGHVAKMLRGKNRVDIVAVVAAP